jgi:type IV pilus assembly protein PilA
MKNQRAFSMIEVMVVIAIITILAGMAVPSYLTKITREQVEAALPLSNLAKDPITAMWKEQQILIPDNQAALLPVAEKIVSNLISSVKIDQGAIHMTFGNKANGHLKNKILTLRPAVVPDAPIVPIAWVCGHSEAPDKMTVMGSNRTNIDAKYLPLACSAKK